ncbi:MAG TPA: hypothetical protein VF318_09185 [Dehalococcoidales bacterium]
MSGQFIIPNNVFYPLTKVIFMLVGVVAKSIVRHMGQGFAQVPDIPDYSSITTYKGMLFWDIR